ncbi:MAG TPA: phosphoribosylamine--glycine ligase [Firmicutes bacterium]|jgi:phosphoribosylamine--glycine ligase|nr:phosphoribosylamine--glycine ligase [Bacillota bacterium]
MQVLLIGAGARENALAARLLESPGLGKLYWLPGNAALEGRVSKVRDIDPCDGPGIATWAQRQAIDLAVIGPEAPLLAGVSDCLEEVGVPCFGPSRAAARLEGSKAFAKDLLAQAGIPTAKYVKVSGAQEALEVLENWGAPVVIKADGLAAGKGVTVAMTQEEARKAAEELTGPAVIEEYLEGKELSFMVLAQGQEFVPLAPSRDHKRAGDGDTGPNTGGMGALAGFGLISQGLQQEIICKIIKPTLAAMAKLGTPYKGVLYAGLMLTAQGPKVLEFNVRFGDPETQAILQLWEDDLLEVLNTIARGGMPKGLLWSRDWAVSLVLASGGYPGSYETGYKIQGLEEALEYALVYQAGTKLTQGETVTAGGRVITLAAKGSLELAREKVYAAAAKIHFPGIHYRRDI